MQLVEAQHAGRHAAAAARAEVEAGLSGTHELRRAGTQRAAALEEELGCAGAGGERGQGGRKLEGLVGVREAEWL
jgi:hypothetical protein